MKRGVAVGIGVGIAIVAIVAIMASGFESVENSTENDQMQTQSPNDSDGGQRFHITLEDSAGSSDAP